MTHQLVGKWLQVDSKNLDEFFIAIGTKTFYRKITAPFKSRVMIHNDGRDWTIKQQLNPYGMSLIKCTEDVKFETGINSILTTLMIPHYNNKYTNYLIDFVGSAKSPFKYVCLDRKKDRQICLLTRESGRKLVQTYKDAGDESKVIIVSSEFVERSDGKKFMIVVGNFFLVLFDRA